MSECKLHVKINSVQGNERNQSLAIIKILLDAGADPKLSEHGESTALEMAEHYGQKDIVDLIQKN